MIKTDNPDNILLVDEQHIFKLNVVENVLTRYKD